MGSDVSSCDRALEYIDPFYFSLIRYGAVAIMLIVLLLVKEGKQAFRLEEEESYSSFGTMAFTVYNVLIFLGQMLMVSRCNGSFHYGSTYADDFYLYFMGYKHIKPKKYMITSMVIAFVGAVFVITKGDMSFFVTLKDNMFH